MTDDKSAEQTNYEQIVLSVASSTTKQCMDEDLAKSLPDLSGEERVTVVNRLISRGLLDVYQVGKRVAYKTKVPEDEPSNLKGADNEEKLVYSIIKEAGNKGIWMRDIRFKSNLQHTLLNKILKSLENKKIIKAVKSVSAYKKKVYMLFELEPDSTLTGGSWYSDQEFESEFVDVLNQQCLRFLVELKQTHEQEPANSKKGPVALYNLCSASPRQVCKFIADLGISKVPLSEEDIGTILDTLYYDGKVERKPTTSGEFVYRAVNSLVATPGLVLSPCGVCPVMKECHIHGQVSSKSCPYLASWGKSPMIKTQTEF